MIKSFLESLDIYFVYCFLDPRKPGDFIYGDLKFDYEPIYIGKGKGIRPQRHFTLYKNYNTRFYSKLSSIINSDMQPMYLTIRDNLLEKEAFEYEKFFIKLIGRMENGGVLTNLTDGGEGQSGFKFSDESKKKMSMSRLGKKKKPMSDIGRLNISLSKIGKISLKKGKTLEEIVGVERSNDIKKKMSDSAKERIGDKNSMFGRKHSDESKEKMSINTIKRFGSDNPIFGRERSEYEKIYDTWELTDKDGNVVIVDNLSKFCRENNLNPSCMRDLSYGTAKSHKNWVKVTKLTNNVKKKKSD